MTYKTPDDIGEFLARLAAEEVAKEWYESERDHVLRVREAIDSKNERDSECASS